MSKVAVCRLCGGRLEYRRRRFSWVHVTSHGPDHPPIPGPIPEDSRTRRDPTYGDHVPGAGL